MVYSFARVSAVIHMKVGDFQGGRRWVRLHEKGGKEHDVPVIIETRIGNHTFRATGITAY
jgi:integrase